jgi:hypothetical protein
MPTVLRIGKLRFYFYANDHKPIHIHVKGGSGIAKAVLEPAVEIVESVGFSPADEKDSQALPHISTTLD